jgi:hypothetical protein
VQVHPSFSRFAPVLLLAGHNERKEIKDPFNTVMTRSLLSEMLKGNLSGASVVAEWIEQNSRLGESPYTVNLP